MRAFISGCAGNSLSSDERSFFRDTHPFGFILFARNCESPDQIRALVEDCRACVDRDDALVLIDQEGGRVQRLRPPHWRSYPPARRFGTLYAHDPEAALKAAHNVTRLMVAELHALGMNVDCIPVLDVPQPGSHDVIGDRAYGTDVDTIVALASAVAAASLDGGVLPVIKHIPGHGRAMADSHKSLPAVDAGEDELRSVDFATFKALSDQPMAMTAHVVYRAIDPDLPATLSPAMISIIRSGIGFDGLLMTDDLGMGALSGSAGERAARAIEAGCDVALHCNGDLDEMGAVANAVPELTGDAASRAERAMACLRAPSEFDVDEALADLDRLLGESV